MVEKDSGKTPPHIQMLVAAILQHQRSEDHQVTERENELVLDVSWRVQLSSRDVEVGQSGTGIKRLEPVRFLIPFAFPLRPPDITLRSDFPREFVPHIYPGSPGDPVCPCIAEVGITDLMFQEGISGVLRSLQAWLDRAAQGTLMDPSQGWEPILFQNIAGSFLDDKGSFLRGVRDASLAAPTTPAFSVGWCQRETLDGRFVYVQKLSKKPFEYTKTPAIVVRAPVGQESKRFQHIDVRKREDLYLLLEHLGINGGDLTRLQKLVNDQGANGLDWLILIVVIKRPMNLIGCNHCFEILPFDCVLTINESPKAKVSPLQYIEAANPGLLQRVSHRGQRKHRSLHFIGVGSVGSKVALSLARTGNYGFHLTDNSLFRGHNLSRHAIADPASNLGFPKVVYMKNAIESTLSVECTISADDASSPTFTIPGAPDAIIESTGAAAVAANLRRIPFDAQLYQVGVYAEAELAFLSAEPRDQSRGVRVDDLEAWLFQQAFQNRAIGRLLFAENEHSRMIVGPGCSSVTTVVSDPKLSLQVSAITERLDRTLQAWPYDDDRGLAAYCVRDPKSGNLSWTSTQLGKTHSHSCKRNGLVWEVRVLDSVVSLMKECRASAGKNETGGAIIGRYDPLLQTVHVTGLVEPPAYAQAGPSLFQIDYPYLQEVDEDTLEQTANTLRVVGTWHSHIGASRPSSTDQATFSDLSQNLGLPFPVMIVYGADGLEILSE
tara:strand:+ start:935 stop:3094 length:2160 start_codon:yes stop_codon:yes gene_type:complete